MTGANAGFDVPYLSLQAAGAAAWLLGLVALTAVRPGTAALRGAVALQVGLCVALPAVWLLGFPVQSGIEGAGRVLFGAPASLVTGALGVVWLAVAGRRAGQGAWATAWPAAAAWAACAVGWLVFLFS